MIIFYGILLSFAQDRYSIDSYIIDGGPFFFFRILELHLTNIRVSNYKNF